MRFVLASFAMAMGCKPTGAPGPVVANTSEAATALADSWTVVLRPLRPAPGIGGPVQGVVGFGEAYGVSSGQVRVLRSQDGSNYSHDFPVTPFTGSAVGKGGALWISLGGLVYRTPDVTGTLTPVERLNAVAVAVGTDFGFACTLDGALVRIPMIGSPEPEGLDVECEALQTREESLFVRDSEGGWQRSTDAGENFEPTPPPEPESLTLEKFQSWSGLDAGPWGDADPLAGTWKLDDELFYDVGASFVEFRGPAGVGRTRDPEGLSCRVRGTAPGPVAVCGAWHEDTLPVSRVFDWEGDWVERAVFPTARTGRPSMEGVIDASSGGVALRGSCEGEEPEDELQVGVCWVAARAEPRTRWWSVGRPTEAPCEVDEETCELFPESSASQELKLVQVQAPHLIYRIGDREARKEVINLRTGELVAFPRCADPRLVGWGHLECKGAGGARLWAFGDRTPQRIDMPKGALSVAFSSWTRGFAAGNRADALWSTIDGGKSWEPLEVSISGRTTSLPLGRATCTNTVCEAPPVLWAASDLVAELEVVPIDFVGFDEPIDLSRTPTSDRGKW